MDAYLKRKITNGDLNSENPKKARQVCPHAQKCYRRNPHHFKEYDHPHLTEFLKQEDPLNLPSDYPQEKKVVEEQLEVLRSLLNIPKQIAQANVSKPVEAVASTSSNQKHFQKREKTTSFKPSSETKIIPKDGAGLNMRQKLEIAAPYNVFFTQIPDCPDTLKELNSLTLTDLLCPSLGELKSSLQFNFMIDIMWLMEQYEARGVHKKPLTVVYGYEFPNMKEYMDRKLPNVTHHLVKMKDPFGTHHSKVGLYRYEDDSIRVVVSTANLYYEDWNHYNQGLWVSPALPRLPNSSPETEGKGPTNFKTDLLTYLKTYNNINLGEWIEAVKRADFSEIRVFLVTSTPGKQYPESNGSHIHRVGHLLSKFCALPVKTTADSEGPLAWGINAQASSIGSLGKDSAHWLRSALLRSLASHKNGRLPNKSEATLNVIFPSKHNVLNSYYGPDGGGCLPYSKSVHEKQKWLNTYLHQWKADHLNRSRAMPHIKSYCRVSPCTSKLAWFLLTSSNISKSAWGGNIQRDSSVYVRSYEVGVMFLPELFGEEYFQIKDFEGGGKKLFPFIYDIPLTSYGPKDEPWTM